MRPIETVIGLTIIFAAIACREAGAAEADAKRGQGLFIQKYGCAQCHGTAGQGGNAGPKIAPKPMPYEALATFVRTTDRQMPPYREAVLPNEDLADIYAFLQSIPASPDYRKIPLLND